MKRIEVSKGEYKRVIVVKNIDSNLIQNLNEMYDNGYAIKITIK